MEMANNFLFTLILGPVTLEFDSPQGLGARAGDGNEKEKMSQSRMWQARPLDADGAIPLRRTPTSVEYKQRVVGREGYYRETSGYGYSLTKTLPQYAELAQR